MAQQGRILVYETTAAGVGGDPSVGGRGDGAPSSVGLVESGTVRPSGDEFAFVVERDPSRVQLLLAGESFDVVLVDLAAPPESLGPIADAAAGQQAVLIGLGAPDDSQVAMAAMRLGARDMVPTNWRDHDELASRLRIGVNLAREMRHRHQLCAPSDDEYARLLARYEDLKQHYSDQIRCFEDSQEAFYLDLSRMMTIIGNIMDGIVFVDSDGYVSLINPVAEDLLATKLFMAVGRRIEESAPEGELARVLREHLELVADRSEIIHTVEVHHATTQDLLYIKVRTTRIKDYRGEFAGTLTTLQDVTAEHKSDQLKNQYLSIVAHELRTPLTGIKTFSTMMAKGSLGELTEKQQRVVDSIREQSLRLEHQIDKLINLGHLESNEYGQDLETLDLGELTSTAVMPFAKPASDRAIRFDVSIDEGQMLVRGDRADLRRALQTLVENAIKFTADGGEVSVRVERLAPDEKRPQGRARITIADDGVGIESRYHRRIFEKFFQVEDPLTRHHGGAGLGLFFARSIVEAHGSQIEVESELGKGTSFRFELTLHAKASPQTSEGDDSAEDGVHNAQSRSSNAWSAQS